MLNSDEEIRSPVYGSALATILLAEDSPQFRNAVTLFLRSRGFDVCCAADGEEAMRLLREKPVDLVVLDLVMPKFDGVDVLSAIRSDADLRGLPVVMATAAAAPVLERELRPTIQAWLVKGNVSLTELLDTVRRHCDGQEWTVNPHSGE